MGITVANDVDVTGNLTVGGSLVIPSISTTGDMTVGDDLTVTDDLLVSGDMTIVGPGLTVRGLPLAEYKRLSFKGNEFASDPAAQTLQGATVNYAGWDFPDVVTSSILLSWAPPQIATGAALDFWTTCSGAYIWTNLSAAAGNVLWQWQVYKFDIGIDATTEAAFLDTQEAKVATAQNVMNAFKFVSTLNLTPGFFGSEWAMRVTRIGGNAADTLAGTARFGVMSLNQVS